MKNAYLVLVGVGLAILTVVLVRILFIRPCNSYSSPTEQIAEYRCKCLGKTIDLADYFGDPNVYSTGSHADQCVGFVYKRIKL